MMDKSNLKSDFVDVENPRSLVFDFSMIFAAVVLVLIGMICVYLRSPKVADKVFGGPEQFGQFGDFIGGLANPLIGICTLGLVMWTITIQRQTLAETRKELNLTRSELSRSNELLASQHLVSDKEHRLKLLESAADRQIDEIEKLLHVNAVDFSTAFWFCVRELLGDPIAGRNVGRNSVANLAIFLFTDNGEVRNKINFQLGSEFKVLPLGAIAHVVKLCKLVYAFYLTLAEMNELLPSDALQKYWKDRLDEYEAIFSALTIDYIKTSDNGKTIIQEPILL